MSPLGSSKEIQKRWVSRLQNSESLSKEVLSYLCEKEKISSVLAPIFLERIGLEKDGFEDRLECFFRPSLKKLSSPLALADMEIALSRLVKALLSKETILVHGDYDVDGIAATVLLSSVLETLGAKTIPFFLPEREIDGYGVSRRGIDLAKEKGACLLLTCDCGITAIEEVDYAKKKGLDVIITDHHLPGKKLPKALAVINPQRKDSKYSFKGLCGTGVAFCFLIALRGRLREQGFFSETNRKEPDLREELDLVALATIADAVPLLQENRILVAQGIKRITHSKRPGIRCLLNMTGLSGKNLSSEDIAFKIIPRLNVAGRMGKPFLALDLLLEKDPGKAQKYAQELDELNRSRREIEAEVRSQALNQIKAEDLREKALILWGEDWHQGVLGIVASRICEKFHLPTAIITMIGEEGKGSLRAMEGVDLNQALEACSEHLMRYGGHKLAAGLTISKGKIKSFQHAFYEFMNHQYKDKDFSPRLFVDEEIELDALDDEFLNQLNLLEPFGQSNPEPVFTALDVECRDSRIVGKNHLKIRIKQGKTFKDAIGFNLGDRSPDSGGKINVAFSPKWNEYQGVRSIQLHIKDLQKG